MMPYTKNTFHICGHNFTKTELRAFSLEKINTLVTPSWEREIWSFILTWLSNEKVIEVTTSGSTGQPKQIKLKKSQMESSAKATLSFFGLNAGDSALLCLPVKYIAGKMMIVRALVGGLDLLFTEPTSIPDLEKFSEIHFTAMTPMQLVGLLDDPSSIQNLLKLKKLILGGSSLPYGLEEKIQPLETEIWQTYGMTETITHIAVRKVNGKKRSDWYNTLPGVEVTRTEHNRLRISYPQIGIKNLLTNDVVEMNSAGEFKLVGRMDSAVNSGGIKLFPEQIEKKIGELLANPFYLAGVADTKLGEKLVLFVEGNTEDQKDTAILEKLKTRLSGIEMPKEVVFKKQFNRTENGKIIRTAE